MLPGLDHTDVLHPRDVVVAEQDAGILEPAFLFDVLEELLLFVFVLECSQHLFRVRCLAAQSHPFTL